MSIDTLHLCKLISVTRECCFRTGSHSGISIFRTYIGELLNSPGEPMKMEHCLKKINALMTKVRA